VTRLPTSAVLAGLLRDAPDGQVTLGWIIARLEERSFGVLMLILAILGLIPGASLVAGVLLAFPAVQMMLGRSKPVLPRRILGRRLSTDRVARLLARVIPTLRRLERVVRPRWTTPFEATKRVVGFVVLLLGGTMLAPIPFSHVIPVFAIALLAFAFLEEDGILLAIALGAAAVSLAITTAAVWGTIEASMLL